MKLTADRSGNNRRFSAKLGWKEHFDPKEMQILSAGAIPMLIPPITVSGRRNNVIQYDISDYSTLDFYLSCILSREQFADILLRCLEVFQRMQSAYLNYKNLVLDLDKIYIRLDDRSVHFIYLPLRSSRREASLPDFFRLLITKTIRSTYEQSRFSDDCLAWLNRPASFVISEFELFIRNNIGVCTTAAAEQALPAEPKREAAHRPEQFVTPDVKAVWTTEPAEFVQWNTSRLDEPVGGTVILGESTISMPSIRYYINRLQTNEKVELTHFPFLVGTEAGVVAYCVDGNPAVSRRHAEFSIRDGECAVTDQKSTNKTYVNDCSIVPFTPQPLKDGDEIRLGNERFQFVREEQH